MSLRVAKKMLSSRIVDGDAPAKKILKNKEKKAQQKVALKKQTDSKEVFLSVDDYATARQHATSNKNNQLEERKSRMLLARMLQIIFRMCVCVCVCVFTCRLLKSQFLESVEREKS